MLNDKQFDELSKPIVEIYAEMERELLKLIASRFNLYSDDVKGSMEWWLKQLDDMGGLNQEAVQVISAYSGKSNEEVLKVLNAAGYASINYKELTNVFLKGGTTVNPKTVNIARVINNSYKQSQEVYKLIQTKALESTKEEYMKSLNKVYLEVSSGIYDYNTAMKRAMKDMAKNGITGATYTRKDGKEVKYSLEAVVRRDTVTAINQLANATNEKMANELGAEYYYLSQHFGARNKGVGHANHESWQGTVTKISGSSKEYPNHHETTGEGLVDGLGGVNCRHHKSAFFPGISVLPKKLSTEENARIYALLEEQRAYERAVRKWKKRLAVATETGDEEEFKQANSKIKEYQGKLKSFVDTNDDVLRRDYSRERIENLNYADQIDTEANRMIEIAKEAEPQITLDIESVVKENDLKLYGKQWRLKTKQSLIRKMRTDVEGGSIPLAEVANGIFDNVRYTAILDDKKFSKQYSNIIESLNDKGYNLVRVKNSLKNDNTIYRGVNILLENRDKYIFELQFHTPSSIKVKNTNHKLYEKYRNQNTNKNIKEELYREMVKNANTVKIPFGVNDIQDIKLRRSK